jgi:hypothetical protein
MRKLSVARLQAPSSEQRKKLMEQAMQGGQGQATTNAYPTLPGGPTAEDVSLCPPPPNAPLDISRLAPRTTDSFHNTTTIHLLLFLWHALFLLSRMLTLPLSFSAA